MIYTIKELTEMCIAITKQYKEKYGENSIAQSRILNEITQHLDLENEAETIQRFIKILKQGIDNDFPIP